MEQFLADRGRACSPRLRGWTVAGSQAKRDDILNGADADEVYNAGRPDEYQVRGLGEVAGVANMPVNSHTTSMNTGHVTNQRPGLWDLSSIPVTELTGEEFGAGLTKKHLGAQADNLLRTLQKTEGLINEDTGWLLRVNNKSRKKMGDNADLTVAEIKAIYGIDQLVRHAVVVESHHDYEHENEFVRAIHRLYVPVRIDGILYRAKLTVKEYKGEGSKRLLHALSAIEIENAPLGTLPTSSADAKVQSAQPTTGRKISISDLLKGATREDGSEFSKHKS